MGLSLKELMDAIVLKGNYSVTPSYASLKKIDELLDNMSTVRSSSPNQCPTHTTIYTGKYSLGDMNAIVSNIKTNHSTYTCSGDSCTCNTENVLCTCNTENGCECYPESCNCNYQTGCNCENDACWAVSGCTCDAEQYTEYGGCGCYEYACDTQSCLCYGLGYGCDCYTDSCTGYESACSCNDQGCLTYAAGCGCNTYAACGCQGDTSVCSCNIYFS